MVLYGVYGGVVVGVEEKWGKNGENTKNQDEARPRRGNTSPPKIGENI